MTRHFITVALVIFCSSLLVFYFNHISSVSDFVNEPLAKEGYLQPNTSRASQITSQIPAKLTMVEKAQIHVKDFESSQSTYLEQAKSRYKLKYGRNTPSGYDKWFVFAQKHKCLIDEYDVLQQDIDPFYRLLTPEQFRERITLLSKHMTFLVRFSVKNGVFEATRSATGSSLAQIIDKFTPYLPDMEMLINDLDEPRFLFNSKHDHLSSHPETFQWESPKDNDHYQYMLKHCEVRSKVNGPVLNKFHGFTINPDTKLYSRELFPIFSSTKLNACFADIITPSWYYFKNEHAKVDPVAWKDKKPVMFWRGTTTGGRSHDKTYMNYHRHRLVNLTTNNPNYDIAFMGALQCEASMCDDMKKRYRFADSVSFEKMMAHKYLIDVDGNSFSQRFVSFLRSNSLVFKMTIFNEYFDSWIQPFIHYIPIAIDYSDLNDKLKWAMENDEEAQQITINAQEFTKRFLTQGQMECYLYLALLEVARLRNENR
ncbi:capsule-associated protein CAP1 [Nowakowskiella sp. JEL0078]|nr:capsule-associated protein CAP1 [Nowakowskiella sp. JEL0078]